MLAVCEETSIYFAIIIFITIITFWVFFSMKFDWYDSAVF